MKNTIIKDVLHCAIPLSITNLLTVLAGIISAIFIAHTGENSLAAFAIANTTLMTLSAFCSACLYGIGILASRARASKDVNKAVNYSINGVYFALLMSVPAMFILMSGTYILKLLNQDLSLIALSTKFFWYSALSMPIIMLNSALGQIFIAAGKPKITTIITAIRLPIIIGLNYYFIFIANNSGLDGFAKAQLYAQLLCLIMVVMYIPFSHVAEIFAIKNFANYEFAIIKKVFNIGIHIGIQFLGELGAISLATYMMGMLGIIPLISAQIVGQVSMIVVMVILAISQAIAIKVSQLHATTNYALVSLYSRCAIWLNTFVILVVGLIFFSFNRLIFTLFNVNAANYGQISQLSNKLMLISLVILILDGIKNVYSNSLRGLGNSRKPMTLGIISLWTVGIPLAYLLGIFFNFGPCFLRIGFACGYLVSAVTIYYYYHRYVLNLQLLKLNIN